VIINQQCNFQTVGVNMLLLGTLFFLNCHLERSIRAQSAGMRSRKTPAHSRSFHSLKFLTVQPASLTRILSQHLQQRSASTSTQTLASRNPIHALDHVPISMQNIPFNISMPIPHSDPLS